MLFKANIFEDVDGSYYQLKPQTWCRSLKIFLNNDDILYIVEKVLKNSIQW